MSKRWVWWSGGGLLVALLALIGWRLSLEIPERLRRLEGELVTAAARSGLEIRHAGLKFHLLHLYLSLDDLEVRDAAANLFLARAGAVELSLSPLRLLRGEIPVSRIRVRDFRVEAGERNRALYEKLTSGKRESAGTLPEILFVDGSVLLGPLGPVRRLEASIRELRIREGRFRGMRISASIARAAGEIADPGGGSAAWPYPSLEAELAYKEGILRVRRARAWGDSSAVRFSGFLDMEKRLAGGKASGEVDLAKWIAGAHPGAEIARHAIRSGKVEFSASVAGPWNNPAGSARILLREGDFHGTSASDGEAVLSTAGRVVRLDRVRVKLMGGVLAAAGSYDVDSARAEGKATFSRFALAAVPWAALGVPFRFAGAADLDVGFSGTPERLRGNVSLSLPDGIERLADREEGGFKVRVPLSLNASAESSGREAVRLETVRLQAGRAEIRGAGEFSVAERTVRLRGTANVPPGKAAEYGLGYPVSWRSVAGEWEVSGPANRPRTTASLGISALTAWSLPSVPLTVKIDGVPAEAIHFVADVPADSFKVTAVGTLAAPMDPAGFRADLSIAVREIDLSEGGKWVGGVLASLGKDPASYPGYLDGATGMGDADARIGLAPGTFDIAGSFRSAEMVVRGIPLAFVKAEAEYGGRGDEAHWKARGEAGFGDGVVRVRAGGAPREGTEVSADIAGLKIAQALSLLKRKAPPGVHGFVDARIEAREGPQGWELPRVSAESKELAIGAVRISGVNAEGTLGPSSGRFSIAAASPRVTVSGEVQRGGGWPAKISLSAPALPTAFLLAAAGREGASSDGLWSVEAGGVVRLEDLAEGKPITPHVFPALHGSVHAKGPAVGEVRFQELRTSASRRGDLLGGELVTSGPDTRLSWELSLREPFGFHVEGPFSIGEAANGAPRDDKRRFSLRGRARIEGVLRAVEKTTGTIRIDTLTYREGGWELSGKDLVASMNPEGIRWDGGTLFAAGTPVRVSGKASWQGDLDVRVDGKLPAGVVRLAVPGVFDRLDGVMTIEARITGNRADPTIVGTGRLEGGTLSFLGYAQQFEGLRADAVLSREKIVFEHFEGRSGGGYIDGWGEVPLKMDAGQRMFFSVDFLNMRYPYPEDFRPVVQGHAELFGPVEDLLVTGEVEVQSARYTRTMYPERALLDFSRRLSDVAARREKSDFRVRLDIDVVADRTIRIKNNLADASASGEFKVQGDSGKVIILGSFDVYEGYAEFYGNRYELKRVTVDFQDPRRNNPRLDARAETRKGGYNVAVLVSGTLEKPEVDFSSDPPLSRTDVVSLLSFGVTTQSLASPGGRPASAPGTVGGAAIAIGSFAGGVDEKIRGAVGLDKFSIETGFSQTTQSFEPRFVVRKSFEDRVSVSMSTSVGTSAETSASGEIRLLENMYLQGGWQSSTSSTPGQISGDVKWRYRFQSLKDLINGRD